MIKNKLELRVCGLQRSGNHAVMDWVINQHRGARICFLNNVLHGDQNPFSNTHMIFTYGMKEFSDGRLREVPENLQYLNKDLMIYSYEDDQRKMQNYDSFLDSVYCKKFAANRKAYLGESAEAIDILIVRDPYNFFASRLKKLNQLTGIKDIDKIILFWKELAQEAIEVEQNPKSSKLVINYNRWFSEKGYRQQLCKRLGGNFSDQSIKRVSSIGGGSSFDKKNFNGTLAFKDIFPNWKKFFQFNTYKKIDKYWKRFRGAQQMKVLERWKDFEEDPQMRRILEDREICYLSQKLFGEIPK